MENVIQFYSSIFTFQITTRGKVDWLIKKDITKLLYPSSVATCQENVSESIV